MIPKIIHLCWLSGDPYPEKIAKCISTWKKHLPDYEIMLWDTNSFDVNSTAWTKEAYEAKKYAFVADYIRFYAVYNYGGIYLDSDVEVLKSFNDMLDLPYFVGEESMEANLEVAIFGAEKGTRWVKDAMDYYKDKHFIKTDGSFEMTVCPILIDRHLSAKYTRAKVSCPSDIDRNPDYIYVLPLEWLCGRKLAKGKGVRLHVTPDTHTVHHCAHSWAEFPGGPLHLIYYKLSGKDWRKHYFDEFRLVQDGNIDIKNAFSHKDATTSEARQNALKHLHEELYDILAEIIRVCDILGLHPFLQGGSAIGAFFDKGIIPWDDDIDVGLVRDEYETFIAKAPAVIKPDYFVQCFESEAYMLLASLLKVRKNGTYFSEEGWDEIPLHHGIFVDIMPYDMVPDNPGKQIRQRFALRKIENVLQNKMLWRYWYKKRFATDSVSNFICSMKSFLWATLFSRRIAYRMYNRVSTRYNGKSGCTFYNQAKQKRDHIAITAIENLEEVPFGPLEAFIPGDVETYLRHHYPNLRPTLPEGERESHMPGRIEFSDGTVFISQE